MSCPCGVHLLLLQTLPVASLDAGATQATIPCVPRPGECCAQLQQAPSRTRGHAANGSLYRASTSASPQVRSRVPHSECACAPRAGERCELNFGERPFAHPLPGFRPLVDPPAGRAAAAWLLACLRRLVLLLLGCGEGLPAARAQVVAHSQREPKRLRSRPHALYALHTNVCLWYWTCEDAGNHCRRVLSGRAALPCV